MRKIIVLIFFILLVGEMGCVPNRHSTATSAIEPNERSRLSENAARSTDIHVGKTGGAASYKSEPIKPLTGGNKPQTIPSLQERFARSNISGECVVHGVQPGETLSEITMQYYGSCNAAVLETLKKTNGIKETDTVQAGWKLIIPPLTPDGKAQSKKVMGNTTDVRFYLRPAEGGHLSSDVNEKIDGNGSEKHLKNRESSGESSITRFQEGLLSFEKKDYPAAYDVFSSLSKHQKHCSLCEEYLKAVEERAALHFETGLNYFRKRNYAKAIQEIEKARIPVLEPQATEYLFKSHFEMALKKFLQYKRSGNRSDYIQAQNSLNQARQCLAECSAGCMEYEEVFKKTHYNNGIKYFTDNDGESMDKAVLEWEKVRFIDPDYKDVSENIIQAKALLMKLKKIKKVS